MKSDLDLLVKQWLPSVHIFFKVSREFYYNHFIIIWMSINPSLLEYPKSCMSWEQNCPSTRRGSSNCWRVAMISPFLWICKVNIKLLTTTLCVVLGHLLYMCLMLGSISTFVVIILWLWSLILMLQILGYLFFHMYLCLPKNW